MGEVGYERAYYHCRSCEQGHTPDAEFRIEQHQTPGARELIALAGVLEPFAEDAQKVLPRMAGLIVSASTVQRTTEAVGEDLARRRAAGATFGPDEAWTWHLDAVGERVAYVSLDATGVPQQGPHGEKAEGRMPWVAALFNPPPVTERKRRQSWDTRYLSGLMSLPEIGGQLRRECQAVGVSQADVVIGLTDGGGGLEDCLIDVLGGVAQRIVLVLDFYHASEHVQEFAKSWLPNDKERQAQVDQWCHTLKHRGGTALLEQVQSLDLSRASASTQEEYRQFTGYLRHNLHRMNYPEYVARGWQIGSGKIESACKTVVGQRLKCGGMRWHERGTTALCHLRALYRSHSTLWADYWKRTVAA